jgi:HSP20 family protein
MLAKYYDSMLKPELFDAFFYGLPTSQSRSLFSSDYRVETKEEGLTLSIDLPGVKSKDLTVQATGREVKIEGKVRGEDFKYTYRVSKDYDPETVDATLEDGVLTLLFKKTRNNNTKTIDIKLK